MNSLSATVVRVSWSSVDIPDITGYIVFYIDIESRKRHSVTVSSSVTFVDIESLLFDVNYQFQVAVIVEVNGEEIIGEVLSESFSEPYQVIIGENYVCSNKCNIESCLSGVCTRKCEIIIGVIFSCVAIIVFVTILLLIYRYCLKDTSKSR